MSTNKTTNVDNTKNVVENILNKITEGAAGIEDTSKFSIHAVDVQEYFLKKSDKVASKKNSKTVAQGKCKREILSTDLTEGMSIVALPYEKQTENSKTLNEGI